MEQKSSTSRSFLSDDHASASARNADLSMRSSFQDPLARSTWADDCESAEEDVFDIPPKWPSTESLKRWKRATLALNAARRFRYTTNDSEEEKLERLKRFLTGAQAVRAVNLFLKAGMASRVSDDFNMEPEKLVHMVREHRLELLKELGGVREVASRLKTSLDFGMKDDVEEFKAREKVFGSNTYPSQPRKPFYVFIIDACKDLTLIILMVCAILSLALGLKTRGVKEGWYDGVSILFAVIIVILVTSISDYRQALQFSHLNEEKKNIQIDVVRGGRRIKISIYQILVGDIVLLNIGDQVPADGLFADGHSLYINQSSLTGESEPIHVHHKMPFLVSGGKVEDGHGVMLVTGVGMATEWGQLMAAIGDDTGEETPLQVRLNGVATLIGKVGMAVAISVLVILLIFYFVGHTEGPNNSGKFKAGQTSKSEAFNSVVQIFETAVTIVVVAVPEGLPLAVTLTLAYAMKKMMADNALVRRLSACETMGSATTICSDKTGTLTLNEMTVVKAWMGGAIQDSVSELQMCCKDFLQLLIEGIVQNSNGSVFVPPEDGKPEVTGSPTEKAILGWGLKLGMDYASVKSQSVVLQVDTFNSKKKRAGVAVRLGESDKVHVHWKGAAEIIVRDSDKLMYPDKSTAPISTDERDCLMDTIEGMASQSLRCLAFAYMEVDSGDVPSNEEVEEWKIPESPLTLLAVVGIKDPARPEVPEAVQRCRLAGIVVRMITGDNLATARAIATECGILQEGDIAIEGVTFRNYSDEMREQELPKIKVMARSSPTDKLLMVSTLKEMGEVVAVTGDGTNDAPALREADIGLAMGIQGTEVAKESSDIVIMDDNFASVVKVVRWGRSVYLNIQKFIQFQLTVNIAALTINFVAAVSSGDVPLTAIQLLWVNLIMDTLGALALATERPTEKLLDSPPIGLKSPLISNVMWRNIFSQAIYQVTVLLVLQFKGKKLMRLSGSKADDINRTVIFNAFVFCQLFNEVNSRKLEEKNVFRGLSSHWLFLGIVGTTVVLQVIIVEFLNKFASTRKLDWEYWVISIVIGFLTWPLSFLVKFIPVPKKQFMYSTPRFRRRRRRREHPLRVLDGRREESNQQASSSQA